MSDDKIRLFVAASIPQDLRRALAETVDRFRDRFPGARWVPVANQHVTLKFVGWFPNARVGDAEAAVSAAVRGKGSTELSVRGIGAFPSERRVRVLWAGLEDPSRTLAWIATALDRAFEPLGVAAEQRDFAPHLTLARFRTPVAMKEALPEVALPQPSFRLSSVELYSSRLSPRGARYEILRSFPIDG